MEYNHCVLLVILCIASAVLCESRENGQERTNGTFIQQLAWRMSADIGYVIEDVKVLIMMQEKEQEETQLMKEEMRKQLNETKLMKEEMKKQLEGQQLMKEEMKKQHDEQRQLMKEEMKKQHDEQRQLMQQLQHYMKQQETVIFRRIDNKYNFDTQLWANYKAGFGDRYRSFWLGLEEIHRLTSRWNYALRVDLTAWDDTTAWARYDQFYIAGEDDGYRLRVGNYSGTAGDSLAYSNGMLFSTRDMDNDEHSSLECATYYQGGWWYKACTYSALTAPYHSEDQRTTFPGMKWSHWKGSSYSFKRAEMTLVLR